MKAATIRKDTVTVADQRSLRDALGRFATGVVPVTATTPDGPVGMAVNSFASVSLAPPLVSFCAAHASTTWPELHAADGFAISVLRANHEPLCRLFATHGADRFACTAWTASPSGHPVVPDAHGWFDCRFEAVHPAGDHAMALARVLRWSTQDNSTQDGGDRWCSTRAATPTSSPDPGSRRPR